MVATDRGWLCRGGADTGRRRQVPAAAGAALYTHRASSAGPFVTFIVASAVMMSGVASASAAAVAFGGKYLQAFVSVRIWPALGFLAVVTLVNFIGISESIKFNLFLTIVEVTGLVIVPSASSGWRAAAASPAARSR